ncbi:MAG: hypothetical protein D6680_02270 [Cyanobacteria bacterium J007]|nr:MAG: hypothetical protein D6680_02270 [Cyanobacteria bacterium J007]
MNRSILLSLKGKKRTLKPIEAFSFPRLDTSIGTRNDPDRMADEAIASDRAFFDLVPDRLLQVQLLDLTFTNIFLGNG